MDQSKIQDIYDFTQQTYRATMHEGYCEMSMLLLRVIDELNREIETLKKEVKKNEMDNE